MADPGRYLTAHVISQLRKVRQDSGLRQADMVTLINDRGEALDGEEHKRLIQSRISELEREGDRRLLDRLEDYAAVLGHQIQVRVVPRPDNVEGIEREARRREWVELVESLEEEDRALVELLAHALPRLQPVFRRMLGNEVLVLAEQAGAPIPKPLQRRARLLRDLAEDTEPDPDDLDRQATDER